MIFAPRKGYKMRNNKQPELSLFPPVISPAIRDIQIATRGIDLFDIRNKYKIVEAVAQCCYGVDINELPADTDEAWEFASQCYEDALIADSAYNPDKGF
jgi:hypothetical protein